MGHILPFELVQAVKLPQELANLKAKENRLEEIAAELQSILDDLSEEEKVGLMSMTIMMHLLLKKLLLISK